MMYEDEIAQILKANDLVFDEVLANGLSNVVVRAHDPAANAFALKYYPRDVFKAEREKRFIRETSDRFPVPSIKTSGTGFLIMDLIPGDSGAIIFSEKQSASHDVGRKIGALVKDLHDKPLTESAVGFFATEGTSDEEYGTSASALFSNTALLKKLISEQEMHLSRHGYALAPSDLSNISVSDDTECVANHHDIDVKNVLFKDAEIVAFLDFEYALAGSRLFDIAKVHVLAAYLAYHTGGRARHLEYGEYIRGFNEAYGRTFSPADLRPFYRYVLLNYILFWISNPIAVAAQREKILPIHEENLKRIEKGLDIEVSSYRD